MSAAVSRPLSGPQIKARLAAIGLNCVELFTGVTLPAAGTLGRIALVTDAKVPALLVDDGSAWQTAGAAARFSTLTAVNTTTSRDRGVRAFQANTYR
jgi:hypothetical protein